METLSLKEFILANPQKDNYEIAKIFNVSVPKVSCNRTWLVRKGELATNIKDMQVSRAERTEDILDTLGKLTNAIEKSTNTYSNEKGIAKQGCRHKIDNKIAESGVYGTIVSLPHIACLIEKMILKRSKSFNFIGVERDDKTFIEMKKTIRQEKLPILPYKGSISDKIYGVERDTYAHLILDYCGFLATHSKEIQYALQNKIVALGGTIHITIMKNFRGHQHIHDKVRANTIVTNGNLDLRCESEVSIRTFFDKVCGFDYDLEEIFYYKDKGKVPMVLIQIKRIA
jgi:hypothetical protein